MSLMVCGVQVARSGANRPKAAREGTHACNAFALGSLKRITCDVLAIDVADTGLRSLFNFALKMPSYVYSALM